MFMCQTQSHSEDYDAADSKREVLDNFMVHQEISSMIKDAKRINGFKIIYWDPKKFRKILGHLIISRVRRNLVVIVGKFYTGKTEVISQVQKMMGCKVCREVKSRPLRPGEVQGQYMISMTKKEIRHLIKTDKMAIVYEGDCGGSRKIAGITIEEFVRCFEEEDDCFVLLNTHPEVAMRLYVALGYLNLFVIWATDRDTKRFRSMREDCKDNRRQNKIGGWTKDISLPGFLTNYVRNTFGKSHIAARHIVRLLRKQ